MWWVRAKQGKEDFGLARAQQMTPDGWVARIEALDYTQGTAPGTKTNARFLSQGQHNVVKAMSGQPVVILWARPDENNFAAVSGDTLELGQPGLAALVWLRSKGRAGQRRIYALLIQR